MSWRVGLGSNRRSQHVSVTTNRAVAHPQYSDINSFRVNDIGIIFLEQPTNLTANIFPVSLVPMDSNFQPMLNIQGMICGFAGSTTTGNEGLENLQAAHVRAILHQTCVGLYQNAGEINQFCAEDATQRSNFCLGDQGGALTVISRGEEVLVSESNSINFRVNKIKIFTQVGIASIPGCMTIPSLYTRISSYREWIFSETGI